MTAFARGNGRDMPAGFCHRTHAVTRHVTGCTVTRSSLEHALDMAGFASGLNVGTGKVEPGLDMIEPDGLRLRGLCHRKMGEGQQRQYKQQPDPPRRIQAME